MLSLLFMQSYIILFTELYPHGDKECIDRRITSVLNKHSVVCLSGQMSSLQGHLTVTNSFNVKIVKTVVMCVYSNN